MNTLISEWEARFGGAGQSFSERINELQSHYGDFCLLHLQQGGLCSEIHNLAEKHPEMVAAMLQEIETIQNKE